MPRWSSLDIQYTQRQHKKSCNYCNNATGEDNLAIYIMIILIHNAKLQNKEDKPNKPVPFRVHGSFI